MACSTRWARRSPSWGTHVRFRVRPGYHARPVEKEFLEDCLAKGMSLPQIGELVGRLPGTVGYWVAKHRLVANGSEKFTPG